MLCLSLGAVNTIFPTYLFFMLEEQLLTLPFQHLPHVNAAKIAG
jgi:hypothetical protein